MADQGKNRKSGSKASKTQQNESRKSADSMSTVSKLFNVLIQFTLLAVAGYTIFRTVNAYGVVLYTFHPALHSIGYLILAAHGILLMSDKHAFFQNRSYNERVTLHWILQAVALVLITVAQGAIYNVKEMNGYPHFQSTHSWAGLTTFIMTWLTVLGGVFAKYNQKLKGFVKPSMLKMGHGLGGSSVFVAAVSTIFLGINQSWIEFGDMQIKFSILGALAVSTVYVVSKSYKTALARRSKNE